MGSVRSQYGDSIRTDPISKECDSFRERRDVDNDYVSVLVVLPLHARHPRELFAEFPPERMQAGVYTLRRGSDAIRIVVAADLPKVERNALLHLFSASADQVQFGAEHYRMHSADASTIVNDLFRATGLGGITMPYTMEDYRKEKAREYLREMTVEQRLALFGPEELVEWLSPKQRLAGLPAKDRLAGLPTREIEAYLRRSGSKSATSRKKKPRSGQRSSNGR